MNLMPSVEEYTRKVMAQVKAERERKDASERQFLRGLDWSSDQWAAYTVRVNAIHSRHGVYLQRRHVNWLCRPCHIKHHQDEQAA